MEPTLTVNTEALDQRPIAFPTAPATTVATSIYDAPGSATYLSEVMGVGDYRKVGLVADTGTGRVWRLAADEGTYLKGTNQAPAPLMHWGAGLHADVIARLMRLAEREQVKIHDLQVETQQGFGSKGSFARGEAVGLVFDLDWQFFAETDASDTKVAGLVQAAIQQSPAVAALTRAVSSEFGLETNARPTPLKNMRSVGEATRFLDPFRRYAGAPEPTDEIVAATILLSQPGAHFGLVLSDDHSGAAHRWHVDVRGGIDPETGLISSNVGFPEGTNDRWCLLSDPNNVEAPSPLAYFSMGTAFCYHTQLCRYVKVRRLPVANPRLAQISQFDVNASDAAVTATVSPLQTKVFINGQCDEGDTSSLVQVAANTCYAHCAFESEVTMRYALKS